MVKAARTSRHAAFPLAGVAFVALGACLGSGGAARAADVTIPIHVEHELIQEVLTREVFDGPGGTANAWKDASGCSFLTLSTPRLGSLGVRLHLLANGEAKVGKKIGAACVYAFEWKGTVDVVEEVRVDSDHPIVHFRVVDATLEGAEPDRSYASTVLRWVETYVRPRLETITVDLRPTLMELEELIPTVLPRESPETVDQIVKSFRVVSAEADPTGMLTRIRLELPDRPAPTAAAGPTGAPRVGAVDEGEEPTDTTPRAEPALTAEELARWDAAWQRWDAFLTFVAKHVAHDAESRELRDALLAVLLDARADVAEILAPTQPGGPDPIRSLFTTTWARLAPVLRTVTATLPGSEALRYVSFISAGDALTALDAMGPQLGFDITADGLRRMARMITPQLAEDPLAYGEQVDPELRRIFGFGTPLVLPGERDAAIAAPLPNAAAPATPPVDDAARALEQARERLAAWAPQREELDEYLPLVRTLLLGAADRAMEAYGLAPEERPWFGSLVLATAWQESCWRHWTQNRGGELKPIRSRAGAVGIMQVLERSWRGFYDLRALRDDIDYNARAGVEILLRYLTEYAAGEAGTSRARSEDRLARTAYAIYHAGPKRGSERVGNPRTPARLRKIDDQFWQRYQYVRNGEDGRVRSCWGGS